MLVVLVIAAVMLVFNTLKLYERNGDNETWPHKMTLQHDGAELLWIYGFNESAVLNKDIHPELTPFFFEPVRINLASEEMLLTLPKIGPGLAKRIMTFRTIHGPIHNKEEFVQIEGIGQKRFADLENHISFY
jgi:hypothetical protein